MFLHYFSLPSTVCEICQLVNIKKYMEHRYGKSTLSCFFFFFSFFRFILKILIFLTTATRECLNSPDSFCYVCGFYVGLKYVSHKTVKGAKHWTAYICLTWNEHQWPRKPCVPHVILCGSCRANLDAWLRGARKTMPFAVPRVWQESKNLQDDCYFCMTDISKNIKV